MEKKPLKEISNWQNDPQVREGFRRLLANHPGLLRHELVRGRVNPRDVDRAVSIVDGLTMEGVVVLWSGDMANDVHEYLEQFFPQSEFATAEARMRIPEIVLALVRSTRDPDMGVKLKEALRSLGLHKRKSQPRE